MAATSSLVSTILRAERCGAVSARAHGGATAPAGHHRPQAGGATDRVRCPKFEGHVAKISSLGPGKRLNTSRTRRSSSLRARGRHRPRWRLPRGPVIHRSSAGRRCKQVASRSLRGSGTSCVSRHRLHHPVYIRLSRSPHPLSARTRRPIALLSTAAGGIAAAPPVTGRAPRRPARPPTVARLAAPSPPPPAACPRRPRSSRRRAGRGAVRRR